MAVRIAIVGPGRVGTAFGEAFHRRGAQLLGFVGRDRASSQRAIDGSVPDASASDCRVLDWPDLARAHVVVFAVGDDDLAEAVQLAVAGGSRSCSLWLHTSGAHDLDVFEPALTAGVRVGSLHPLLPFADGPPQPGAMKGALALLAGPARSMRLLRRLSALLELEPIECGEQDRVLYHAACALAANGSTALFGLVVELFEAAGGLPAADGPRIAAALARAAIATSLTHGAEVALSGPVRRGDAVTVGRHLQALANSLPPALPSYRALMQQALRLAAARGLSAEHQQRVAAQLAEER